MSLCFTAIRGVGLIKGENGGMPPPSTTIKAAAPEAATVDDDSAGISPKPAAKAVNTDTAKKVSFLQSLTPPSLVKSVSAG